MIRVRGMFQKSLKNRSSKHLKFMTGPGTKPALWSWSNEALKKQSVDLKAGNVYDAELKRRADIRDKRKTPRPPCKSKAAEPAS